VHHHPGQVKVAPPTGTTVLHSACLAAAFPAPDGPPPRGDIHDQAETLEVEAPDDEVLELPVVGSIVLNGISINPANASAGAKPDVAVFVLGKSENRSGLNFDLLPRG
jgi:hypothetical protein